MNLVQQKFDFHAAMCYNFKAKLANQCLIKLDVRTQGPDKIMGGLSKVIEHPAKAWALLKKVLRSFVQSTTTAYNMQDFCSLLQQTLS